MVAVGLAPWARALAMWAVGAHMDIELGAMDQLRVGDNYTPHVAKPNILNVAEIFTPKVQFHFTFGANQDLMLRYQLQLLQTYQNNLGSGPQPYHLTQGWTMLNRVLATYAIGEEHALKLNVQFDLSTGQLDTSNPDSLVTESGILPGALGAFLNYTNTNLTAVLTRRFGRNWRLTLSEVAGLTEYGAQDAIGYFVGMPALKDGTIKGTEMQLRVASKNQLAYLMSEKSSVFLSFDLSDVSYSETASFPGFAPSVGVSSDFGGLTQLKAQGGFIKYWTNPFAGEVDKPGYLPVLTASVDHIFSDVGLPRLKGHFVAGIAPFYNLQYANLEPRSTLAADFAYALGRSWTAQLNATFLTSLYWNFERVTPLPPGHPKNIVLLSLGLRYNWRNIFMFDAQVFGSDRSYTASGTQPYTQLEVIYGMLGLTGTWQNKR